MNRMAEAEVSLRLAEWLLCNGLAAGPVVIAIDGAQVQTSGKVHFDLRCFLQQRGWNKVEAINDARDTKLWQGLYGRCTEAGEIQIRIQSKPGCGDVVALLRSGKRLWAECKKGPLGRSTSSEEYRLLREGLGQLLTLDGVGDDDVLAVAVPQSKKFEELTQRWRRAPLVKRLGIRILTVGKDGSVAGLDGVL